MNPVLRRALEDARAGRLEAALKAVRIFVSRQPRDVGALQVLGSLLLQAGQYEQAGHALERAIAIEPRMAALRNSYANVLIRRGEVERAVEELREAVGIDAGYGSGWLGLTCALATVQRYDEAIEAARRGIEVSPDLADLHVNLVLALEQSGQLESAVEAARRGQERFPEHVALHSLLLYLLTFMDMPAEAVATEHARFGEVHGRRARGGLAAMGPERALRIGLMSSDLKTHSVGYFVSAVVEAAPEWAEVVVFSLAPAPGDAMAEWFKARVGKWIEVGHMTDAAIDARIREERIDVLIELNGHAGLTRPGSLLGKPAPVIITAIGYPNTTGIPGVDYRVVDSITDPAGSEGLCTERLLRIDPCFLCYTPPADAPVPRMPEGELTFGSFNQISKIGERTCGLWAGAMAAAPGARLLIKSRGMSDSGALARVRRKLEGAGIEAGRIEIVPAMKTLREHLEAYSRVHVALDTVPYNGTTTTCEALWMGVPVVTVAGDRHASRVGMSLLSAAGLGEMVADDEAGFATVARRLSESPERIAALRAGLRGQVLRSVLCDGAGYGERFYSAIRRVWREACERGTGG